MPTALLSWTWVQHGIILQYTNRATWGSLKESPSGLGFSLYASFCLKWCIIFSAAGKSHSQWSLCWYMPFHLPCCRWNYFLLFSFLALWEHCPRVLVTGVTFPICGWAFHTKLAAQGLNSPNTLYWGSMDVCWTVLLALFCHCLFFKLRIRASHGTLFLRG